MEYWDQISGQLQERLVTWSQSLAGVNCNGSSSIGSIFLKSLLGVVIATAVPTLGYHYHLSHQRRGEAPIRWSWIPILGWAIDLGKRPVKLLQECAEIYGEIFGIVVGGNRMFFISDVLSTSAILKGPKELSFQEFTDDVMHNVFGCTKDTVKNKFTKSFDQDMRKIYSQYLLTDKHLHQLTARMYDQLNEDLPKVGPNQEVSLFNFISKLVFRASVRAVFNEDVSRQDELYDCFMATEKAMPLAVAGVPMDYFASAAAGRTKLRCAFMQAREQVSDLIRVRWDAMMKTHHISEEEVAKTQTAMNWASVSNTMPATFWLVYYLSKNRDCLQKLRTEVKQIFFPNTDDNNAPWTLTQENLNQLVYADACITEVLRLTSGSLIMRIATADVSLTLASGKTYKFRKGDRIGLSPTLFHLDPELFPDPYTFKPDRWLNAPEGATIDERIVMAQGKIMLKKNGQEFSSQTAFLPFGSGTTYCPGRRFARNEIKLIMIMLLNKFNFDLMDPQYLPEIDGSRAGIGVYPPLNDTLARLSLA